MVKMYRYFSTILYFIIILVIGTFDYEMNVKFNFLLFYLIPIILLSQQKDVKIITLIFSVFLSTFFVSLSDYYSIEKIEPIIFLWDTFIRFTIFSIISNLILNLTRKNNMLLKTNDELETKNKYIETSLEDLINRRKEER